MSRTVRGVLIIIISSIIIIKLLLIILLHYYSKGDLESAVQCLELYVKVAEKSGATESLAKSCRAAGTIFNTLVNN